MSRRMFTSRMDKLIEELSTEVAKEGIGGHKEEQQAMRNYIELTE